MNDLGWGRSGGNGGNKGSGGGQGSGGSVCAAHGDGLYAGDCGGPEGARQTSGGCIRGAR